MAVRPAALVAVLAAAGLPAGCGGSHGSRSPTTPGEPVSGRALFAEHCSACHSLDGHDNPRLQGGDLLGFHATRREVVQFVREMPVLHRPLTSAELQAVVDYVTAAERAAGGR